MRRGYARVSMKSQNIEAQLKALTENGCDVIYKEKASGKSIDERKEFKRLLNELESGDTLVITKLDRISRNVKQGIELIDELNSKGIALHVLNMGLFDNTSASKLIRNILLSVADFEREIMLERQREGIEIAKANGVYKGMPKRYTDRHKGLQHALELFNNRASNGLTVAEIEAITKVSKSTLYREAKARSRNGGVTNG